MLGTSLPVDASAASGKSAGQNSLANRSSKSPLILPGTGCPPKASTCKGIQEELYGGPE